jgi:hypothetical protein
MPRLPLAPLSFALALVFFVVSLAACQPDREAFLQRTFFCDASSNRPRCGTAEDGTALTCFGGTQLGAGRDFCVESCAGDSVAAGGTDSVCLKQAKLRTCRPSDKTPDDPDGCGKDLACLRTDLTRDEGVCLAMRICSGDADCANSPLNMCASTMLKSMFPRAPYLTGNVQCVLAGCKASQTECPLGETCLAKVVPSTTPVPDICVPTCDSDLNCPPNYACWRRLSGPDSPSVCIPTLPGSRCTTSLDCWAGECIATDGFSLCALPCERDADCVPFSDSSHRQYCVPAKGDKRYCMAVSPFAGSLCKADSNCPAGQTCFFSSPYWSEPTAVGECRPPCGQGDRCAARGGLPHACFVRGADRSCYPGVLGVTCQRSEECAAGRTCQRLAPESGSAAGSTAVCTSPCGSDVDCLDSWNDQEAYCAGGWCRLARNVGGPCTRDQECADSRCAGAAPDAPGTCTKVN